MTAAPYDVSPISDLDVLLSTMDPVVNPGTDVYTSVPHHADIGCQSRRRAMTATQKGEKAS